MKKALISKLEKKQSGYRVAQVVDVNNTFPVAVDLYWVDCDDNINADEYWYDPSDNSFKIDEEYLKISNPNKHTIPYEPY
jgi:hypothetical protein